jgi:hypothetical protein
MRRRRHRPRVSYPHPGWMGPKGGLSSTHPLHERRDFFGFLRHRCGFSRLMGSAKGSGATPGIWRRRIPLLSALPHRGVPPGFAPDLVAA